MGGRNVHLRPDSVPPRADTRLDSWKEIASYLNRDIRTVQRWEKQEGLPVHRHVHGKQGSVYAFKAELDTWWNDGRRRLERQEPATAASPWRRGVVAAAAFLVLAAAGVSLWVLRRPRPIAFKERDWVLITNFDNRTGEPVLDGSLEYAFERELSNSSFVNVVPRQRVNDVLLLMKRPVDTRLDRKLGEEICLRDGGVRALLTGRAEKLDSTYILTTQLVDPVQDVTLASLSEEASGQTQILPAVRRLSSRVRETLGEKLQSIQVSERKLEQVTTPSLQALQLYTRAMAANEVELDPSGAAELLREALADDPDFASAHLSLALCLVNMGRPESDWRPHADRAYQLAARTSDRERYFILGLYHFFQGEYDQAIGAYQALLRIDPDSNGGLGGLIVAYTASGRWKEEVPYLVRFASLQPQNFSAQGMTALILAVGEKDLGAARPFLEQARTLAAAGAGRRDSQLWSWVELFPVYEHWLAGDIAGADQELTRVAENVERQGPKIEDPVSWYQNLALCYLTLGEARTAARWYKRMPDQNWREAGLACVAEARGDGQGLREHLTRVNFRIYESPTMLSLLIKAGMLSEADRDLRRLEEVGRLRNFLNLPRGELSLARGQVREAIPLLLQARGIWGPPESHAPLSLASESMAEAVERRGEWQKAVQVLEEAGQERAQTYSLVGLTGWEWICSQVQLVDLYRKLHRDRDAQKLANTLSKLLARADPDLPVLAHLRRTSIAAFAPKTK